jgi:dTDP-glucose 4,6-dehydratase
VLFRSIFTRLANFYGPGQQLYRIVPRTIIYALSGKKLQLHGGGTSIRAFIYAADIADGIMLTINKGTIGEVYHFSPERFLTIRQVVEIICQQMRVDFDALTELAPERPGKDLAYLMNSSKARTKLGWQESVSFEQGINASVEWVKASFDEILTLPLDYVHKT